jgi:hypothetical protein
MGNQEQKRLAAIRQQQEDAQWTKRIETFGTRIKIC